MRGKHFTYLKLRVYTYCIFPFFMLTLHKHLNNTIMTNSRVIKVTAIQPTNHRGFGVKLTEARYKTTERVKVPSEFLDYGNSIKDHAISYLESIGINVVSAGWINDDCYIMSNSWADESGFINLKGEIE